MRFAPRPASGRRSRSRAVMGSSGSSLHIGKKGGSCSSDDRDEPDDSESDPQHGALARLPPDHGNDPPAMNEQVDGEAAQEHHRDPEVDLAPFVAIEAPDRRAMSATRWKHIAEEHARRREQNEGREGGGIDDQVEAGPFHDALRLAVRRCGFGPPPPPSVLHPIFSAGSLPLTPSPGREALGMPETLTSIPIARWTASLQSASIASTES